MTASGWSELQVTGQTVFNKQDPSAPQSFHLYTWHRNPVGSYLDGPNDAGPELRQWVEAYFKAIR